MLQFDYSELNKMEKQALILLVMQLYKEVGILKEKTKKSTGTGVFMEGTTKRVKSYYDSALEDMKKGGVVNDG